jgi:Zn-dependent protease
MNGASLVSKVYEASTWVVPIIIAVTFHEAAHGFIALRFGDDTALRAHRVTFNPLNHIDRFGTIILPVLLKVLGSPFLFGYAKPVPVNFARLNNPRRDMVWVALAGPVTNVLLAIAAATAFHGIAILPGGPALARVGLFQLLFGELQILPSPAGWVAANILNAIIINAVLCVFNMLPLPPLDGGRVAVGLLPRPLALPLARLERYGIGIVLLLLFVLPWIGGRIGWDLNILGWLVGVPAGALIWLVLAVTGQSE